MVRPRVLAVLRLITSSNFVGSENLPDGLFCRSRCAVGLIGREAPAG